MDIPTLSTWDGYKNIGLPVGCYKRITTQELQQIKAELKRKTIKDVAFKFNRHYSTIWYIAKET